MPGRELPPSSPFSGDDGSCDPSLAQALDVDDEAGRTLAVVAALSRARVLVPVVAVEDPEPHDEHVASAAMVTVAGPDGRAVLPVFSSVDALRRWDPKARPIPAEGRRAALAASVEADGLLVLDPAGPIRVIVPRPATWALAQGRDWVPAVTDPDVAVGVASALAGVPGVLSARCEPGERAELRVVVGVRPGLTREGLDEVVAEAGRALAAAEIVADRVDSLEVKVVRAS